MNNQVFKNFCKYVSFNILGQIAYSCYTLADTFFVSVKTGTDGLTALNLAFPVFCLISGIGLMIGIGGGTQYSILKSRNEHKSADHLFTNAVYLALAFAAVFFLSGLFFSDKIVRVLGADDQVFSITNIYLKVLMLFSPAFLLNHLLQCFVRNDGNPSLSMAAMMIGSLSNIILDYVFIFPFQMGIFGAAFATGLSPVISIMVLLPYFLKKRNGFHFLKSSQTGFRFDKICFKKIVTNGIPPFLTEAASGVVMFLFNFIILRLTGNTGVAAFGVITVISLVVIALYTGLSQGIQPLISQSYGLQNRKDVHKLLKYALLTAFLLSAAIYAVIFWNAPFFVSVFNSEKDIILQEYAVRGLRLYFTACPFIGLNITLSTYFISINKAVPAQIISFLRSFFVLIPMAFLLSSLWEMTGVWCSYPLTEFLVAIVTMILCFRHFWSYQKREI
ncbi:MAG: MATE family efflux transporter [Eubacteriales bacterium]|nr:MATE family efflux transporter [Eubacteriales bacterium]